MAAIPHQGLLEFLVASLTDGQRGEVVGNVLPGLIGCQALPLTPAVRDSPANGTSSSIARLMSGP